MIEIATSLSESTNKAAATALDVDHHIGIEKMAGHYPP